MRPAVPTPGFASVLLLGACSYLGFLKPPTVPRERGRATVEHGAALAPASTPAARMGDED